MPGELRLGVPLGGIVLDVDELPRVNRHRVRVHPFNVRLSHPVGRAGGERDDRLRVEKDFFRLLFDQLLNNFCKIASH